MSFATTLRHRVTILKLQTGTDSINQPLTGWTTQGQRWANVRLLGGLETLRAGAETSIAKASIRMRYGAPVDASMRLQYGGITYAVKAVLPDPSRQYVDFTCESVK